MSGSVARVRSALLAPFRGVAGRIAAVQRAPTPARAVFSHFAKGGGLELGAIRLKSRVDDAVEGMVADAFGPVERAIAEEFDVDPAAVEFDYETKLLRPAELTLGRLYRRAILAAEDGFDPVAREVRPGIGGAILGAVGVGSSPRIESEFSHLVRNVEHAERVTELVVVALLDGDMRDAINDDEYGDFRTALDVDEAGRRRVAEIAQSTLEAEVERRFERFPDGVREAYDRAVDVSEAHQDRDGRFRELLAAAREGEPGAEERIEAEYRDAPFEDPPAYFEPGDVDLPYLRTQYGRVGVIYEGMIEMYREAGIQVDDAFQRSIVLSIVGAQVWLDDVDDFEADMAEGQLTPVTAEYLLADSDADAYRRVRSVTDRYLDVARGHAVASGAPLTAIAIEYIRHSGTPSVLPGSDAAERAAEDGDGAENRGAASQDEAAPPGPDGAQSDPDGGGSGPGENGDPDSGRDGSGDGTRGGA